MRCAQEEPPARSSLPEMRRPCRVRAAAARFAATCALLLGAAFAPPVLAADGINAAPNAVPVVTPDAARRAELITLVRQDCGSCHGLTLKGGLGPSLVPEALQDKPAMSLKATILHGRPGTAMPPWQRFLSEADADWIVANLQKGFPDER